MAPRRPKVLPHSFNQFSFTNSFIHSFLLCCVVLWINVWSFAEGRDANGRSHRRHVAHGLPRKARPINRQSPHQNGAVSSPAPYLLHRSPRSSLSFCSEFRSFFFFSGLWPGRLGLHRGGRLQWAHWTPSCWAETNRCFCAGRYSLFGYFNIMKCYFVGFSFILSDS